MLQSTGLQRVGEDLGQQQQLEERCVQGQALQHRSKGSQPQPVSRRFLRPEARSEKV